MRHSNTFYHPIHFKDMLPLRPSIFLEFFQSSRILMCYVQGKQYWALICGAHTSTLLWINIATATSSDGYLSLMHVSVNLMQLYMSCRYGREVSTRKTGHSFLNACRSPPSAGRIVIVIERCERLIFFTPFGQLHSLQCFPKGISVPARSACRFSVFSTKLFFSKIRSL